MIYGSVIQTHPAIEPVTLEEFKSYLRIEGAGEDRELVDLIEEARQWIEDQTGLALITQTWLLSLDRWPRGESEWWDGTRQGSILELHSTAGSAPIEIPRFPLQSVTSVTTYASDGTSTVVDVAATFDVDTNQTKGRVTPKDTVVWSPDLRQTNAIEVVYLSGYGDTEADVPRPLRRAVKQVAAGLYTHRGDGCEGVADTTTRDLIATYRVARL